MMTVIYLGLILGAMGSAIACIVFNPKDGATYAIYVLSGCVTGVLVGIAIVEAEVSKCLLVSIIAFSYTIASIAGQVAKK